MKRIFSIVAISIFLISISTTKIFASDGDKKIAAKLNAAALVGVINPSFEMKVHQHFSLQIEGMGIFYPYGIPTTDKPLTLGATFLEGHWYPKKTFDGFYVGPNFGWGVWRLTKWLVPAYWGTYPDSYQMGSNIMAGVTLGYQFCIGERWGIDISLGLGYSISAYEGHNTSDGSMYVEWNKSGEWLPAYKGAVNVVYKW